MKKIFIIILTLGVLLASCEESLEKSPLDTPSSEVFLSTEKELQSALVGCHSPLSWLPNNENSWVLMFEQFADVGFNRDVAPHTFWGDPTAPASSLVLSMWTNMYRGISRCNFLLENANRAKTVPAANRLKIEAGARFLRAYYYHILCELYGDVPLVTRTLSLDSANVARTPKAEVVNFIITELDTAAKYLEAKNSPNTMTISKGAAWALQSRVALFNGKWQKSMEAANKVMKLEPTEYILNPSYAENFTRKGKTSKEIIWAIQFNYDNIWFGTQSYKSRLGGGFSNRAPVQNLVDSYEDINGYSIDNPSSVYNPKNPYANRDPRLKSTVAVPGSVFLGYQFETKKDSLTVWNYNVKPAVRVPNTDATNAFASYSGYCWRKYVDSTETNATKSDLNIIVFRYGEVLLNYAEARIEANVGDDSARIIINKIRKRVNMPAIAAGKTQEEMRSVVRKERKYELAGEGSRYFDIIRWRIAEEVFKQPLYGRSNNKGVSPYLVGAPKISANGTPDYSLDANTKNLRVIHSVIFDPNKNYLWPIPFLEIQTNTNLIQNPNY